LNLAAGVRAGERRALAKAITLVESTRADHREQADVLLTELMPATGGALRLGISGVPGVGKSTFIEAFGLFLIDQGHRVAVLAVDPSSSVSGGAILGDKTRMERLSMDLRAFIRPSPSSGTLGGVAEKTREAMLLCEAAGFDVVIVETVGVGQSETAVAGMTDLYVLLQLPNAGDDLQAIKKGVMELADLIVINKADLDPAAATRAQAQITSALRLLGSGRTAPAGEHASALQRVLQVSALKADGIAPLWAAIQAQREQRTASGAWAHKRREQSLAWMWERVQAGLRQAFISHPGMAERLAVATAEVRDGRMPASTAARQLLAAFQSSEERSP
jgi:LAO/AO transport system kinase